MLELIMGDDSDLCESYGGSAGDPDFLDNFYDTLGWDDTDEDTQYGTLKQGTIHHIVKLKSGAPSRVVGVRWNLKRNSDYTFPEAANHLLGGAHDDPAKWFLDKGFKVRSKKEDGYWYQFIFKDSGAVNAGYLKEKETKQYESTCPELKPTEPRMSIPMSRAEARDGG
jgi:hypothetical protein